MPTTKSKSPRKFIEKETGGDRTISRFQPGANKLTRVKPTITEKIAKSKLP